MSRPVVLLRSVLAAATALGALALAAPPAAATSAPEQIAASTASGVGYLRSLQAADGSYAGPGLSDEWAFSALAAAGTAAVDVVPGDDPTRNARDVYRALLGGPDWPSPAPAVTDYARALLNAHAAGIDPARVSPSRNLVADVYGYWQAAEPGYFGSSGSVNGTVFAALALNAATTASGRPRVPAALRDAVVARVRANQHDDGGWTYGRVEGDPDARATAGDVDMTGAAMAALCTSGIPRTDPAIARATAFLTDHLVADSGAFGALFGANTDSTAWAVSGLNACRIDPQSGGFVTPAGRTPVDFLLAQQFTPGGGFRYLPGDAQPSAYASIDALRAVAGGGFTAPPAVPTTPGAARWVGTSAFAPGTPARLALTVDDGAGDLRVCPVTVTPAGGTTTLGAVLDAALGAGAPAGCVTGVAPASGAGRLTAVNGRSGRGPNGWRVSVDGAPFTTASRGRTVHIGDTIALRRDA